MKGGCSIGPATVRSKPSSPNTAPAATARAWPIGARVPSTICSTAAIGDAAAARSGRDAGFRGARGTAPRRRDRLSRHGAALHPGACDRRDGLLLLVLVDRRAGRLPRRRGRGAARAWCRRSALAIKCGLAAAGRRDPGRDLSRPRRRAARAAAAGSSAASATEDQRGAVVLRPARLHAHRRRPRRPSRSSRCSTTMPKR